MLDEMLEEIRQKVDGLGVGERLAMKGVPEEVYFASPGIGSSAMREAVKSMAHYKHYLDTPRDWTPDKLKGSAIHTMVLEPDEFFNRFVIPPNHLVPGTNAAYKAWKAEQTLPIITPCMMAEISATAESVMLRADNYFINGVAEKSYWYRDESGMIFRARIDYEIGDLGVDLKSTKETIPHRFVNTVKYDYNIQDALYRLVTGLGDFIFIGASKKPPHQIFAARQTATLRKSALELIRATVERIQIAEEFNDYPLPPVEILETE